MPINNTETKSSDLGGWDWWTSTTDVVVSSLQRDI